MLHEVALCSPNLSCSCQRACAHADGCSDDLSRVLVLALPATHRVQLQVERGSVRLVAMAHALLRVVACRAQTQIITTQVHHLLHHKHIDLSVGNEQPTYFVPVVGLSTL